MRPEEFTLVRDLLRTFAAQHAVGSADEVEPRSRAAAQGALDGLGLAELRGTALPAATVQECALLAEEHGRLPLTTSLLGTALLAPELLRLLGADGHDTRFTVALDRDLRFPGPDAQDLRAWDCDGAGAALYADTEGNVTRARLGPPAPTADLLRSVRRASAVGAPLGRLGPQDRQRWQAYALVVVASELVGAAGSFVEQGVAYARDRRQYGRRIGSFQAVQHLLADATVLVAAGTSATRYAAWCVDREPPDRALAAARAAKAEVNTSAVQAVYAGMQVFGGIAQTWEHLAHLYLRKVLVGATVLATTADLLPVLAVPEVTR
ncbi:acyl-CoA dehydrogenase family protein [Streptomyces fuscichromogenes]|uniref:acyl-CoA dehydrogenase family protein n=1 Tax=Streptomyces fuscichromogenes TaxID=1324013 RepID=UPI00382E0620